MYKSFTAEDFRKILGVAPDYRVDGLVLVGAALRRSSADYLRAVAEGMDLPVTVQAMQPDGVHESVLAVEYDGKRLWCDTVYGGARTSELCHVAALLGAQRIFLAGSCGGLRRGARYGDIVVATASYGDESTTRMYRPGETLHPADAALAARLAERLSTQETVLRGPLITCQAMLAETWEDVVAWSEAGYCGVEMESSTVLAVANHFGVPAAVAVSIVDNLIEKETIVHDQVAATRDTRMAQRAFILQTMFRAILQPDA